MVRLNAGGEHLCAEITDQYGVATCDALSASAVTVVTSLGYTTTFLGDYGDLPSRLARAWPADTGVG